MNRRGFLKAAAMIVAAPAIVKAENLMKVWVPPEKKIITPETSVIKISDGILDVGHVFTITGYNNPDGSGPQKFVVLGPDDAGGIVIRQL